MITLFLSSLLASADVTPHVDADTFCLAENLYHEARGEEEAGMLAVNAVVLNRAFRDNVDICDVVFEEFQFSWTLDENLTLDLSSDAWKQSLAMAEFSLNYHFEYDYSNRAYYYYNPNVVTPDWSESMRVTARIGNHVFLTDQEDEVGLEMAGL